MNKRSFILFLSLFIFWIAVSGTITLQHIIVGLFLSIILTLFWKNLAPRLPRMLSFKELFYFIRCIFMLIGYVVKSNIEVARILLFSRKSISPMFIEVDFGVKSDWGKVFLATCITITPGSITIDVNPDNNKFTVHALTRETAINLYHWRIITEIKNLEMLVMRREAHAIDIDRIHDSNSTSIS